MQLIFIEIHPLLLPGGLTFLNILSLKLLSFLLKPSKDQEIFRDNFQHLLEEN